MSWKPTKDYLIVAPIKVRERTEGGLFLPGTATDKPGTATIIAAPKDSIFNPGDTVLYMWHNAIENDNLPEGHVLIGLEFVLATKPYEGDNA